MISWSNCCRLPWRGCNCRLSIDMLIPVLTQPIVVFVFSYYSCDNIAIVAVVSSLILLIFVFLTKYDSRSQILYYWITSSITYVIIVFQNIVVPLSEIERKENFVLALLVAFSLYFLYLTKNVPEELNRHGNSFSNGVVTETCPICRVKITPRSYHCRVCQICVSKYDYHCYWLSCCIGENNQHFFVVGIIFGMLALGYASLLILTTICQPDFVFGILLPKDCTDVSATLGMFICFVSGIYIMELAIVLLLKFVHLVWLISKGYSAWEWKKHYQYSICHASPYSRGLLGNWMQFFKNFKKIRL